MNRLRISWLDVFILVFGVLLLTAGEWFLTPPILEHIRLHPAHHRKVLSLVALIFLPLLFILNEKNQLSKSLILKTFSKLGDRPVLCVSLIFLLMSSVFGYSSYLRYRVFRTGFDFAIFAQAIWNTWHGSFLYSSIKGGICLLGDHISPILAVFAPLYALGDHPSLLLIAQAAGASSAVFPLYLIGKKVLDDQRLALMFVALYALYLPLRNAVRFDFHPEIAADFLILWAFYFLITSRLRIAFVFLMLTLSIKETACAPVVMLGIYAFLFQRKYLFGILTIGAAISVFLLDVYVIAPRLGGAPYFYFGFYSEGPAGALKNIFQLSASLTYLCKIFSPVGFALVLFSPAFLLTTPILFQNLSAGGDFPRSIFFQYTAFLTPFVFVAAIFGFKNVLSMMQTSKRFSGGRRLVVYYLVLCSFLFNGVSEYHVIAEHKRLENPHLDYVRHYLKTIPSDVSVRTHEPFAAHLSNRKELHIYDNHHPKEGGSVKAQNAQMVIIDERFIKDPEPIHVQIEELKSKGYQITHEHDGFYVLSR